MSALTQTANTLTSGHFMAGDFIRPNENDSYAELHAELTRDLAPVGILETTLVDEIRRAMWRLRRCGQVEANLVVGLDDGKGFIFDPMETANTEIERVQKSVDRARAQAHRLLHKCAAELRKLQTERQLRNEFVKPETDTPRLKPTPSRAAQMSSVGSFCKTPRSAQCPCNSGQKYKRCCGRGAPPLLHAA